LLLHAAVEQAIFCSAACTSLVPPRLCCALFAFGYFSRPLRILAPAPRHPTAHRDSHYYSLGSSRTYAVRGRLQSSRHRKPEDSQPRLCFGRPLRPLPLPSPPGKSSRTGPLSQSPSKLDRRPIDRCRPRRPHQHPCFTISKRTTAIHAGAHNLACAPTIAHPGCPRKSVCLCAV
jgi:hypothetical protein